MEQLTIRDWMVIIGAVMIFAVLVDAVRRVWRERRAEVRLNAKISRADADQRDDEPFNLLAELPNGGARIVARGDLQPEATPLTAEELAADGAPHIRVHQSDARADHPDTRTDDPDFRADDPDTDLPVTPSPNREEAPAAVVQPEPAVRPPADEPPVNKVPAKAVSGVFGQARAARRRRAEEAAEPGPETLDWLDQLDGGAPPEPAVDARLPRDVDPHVFVLNVVARADDGFAGADILHILLACDLRFGDMDFFHRHEQASGRGPIQFSVANMMKPGVFAIDAMDQLRTKGLMFFLTLPGPEDMLQAFDYMYETAKTVARNLDGDVLDETRSAITRQSLEHMRQQIRELERRLMVGRERR